MRHPDTNEEISDDPATWLRLILQIFRRSMTCIPPRSCPAGDLIRKIRWWTVAVISQDHSHER